MISEYPWRTDGSTGQVQSQLMTEFLYKILSNTLYVKAGLPADSTQKDDASQNKNVHR